MHSHNVLTFVLASDLARVQKCVCDIGSDFCLDMRSDISSVMRSGACSAIAFAICSTYSDICSAIIVKASQ